MIFCARATREGSSVWLDGLSGLSGSSGDVFGPANQTNEIDKIDQMNQPPFCYPRSAIGLDEKEGELAEWVTYKNHQIKACSQHLGDDRWMPKALAWLSMGGRAPMKTLQGESHEVSNTESKANVIALGKAKKWVDQHQ